MTTGKERVDQSLPNQLRDIADDITAFGDVAATCVRRAVPTSTWTR